MRYNEDVKIVLLENVKLSVTQLKKKLVNDANGGKSERPQEIAARRLGGEGKVKHTHPANQRSQLDWLGQEQIVAKGVDSTCGQDGRICPAHVQRAQQDDGCMGKQRGGREDGTLSDQKEMGGEDRTYSGCFGMEVPRTKGVGVGV